MNSVKEKTFKLILGFTSLVILILLMLTANLYASHYRYGTMSWTNAWDNGTIRLKMQNAFRYTNQTVGTISNMSGQINWGDGSTETVQKKVIAVDSTEGSYVTEIGSNSTGAWVTGVLKTYTDNGTYIVSWTGGDRIDGIENSNLSEADWRLETKVNIGGTFASNDSSVSAVPPIVQIQDNTTFNYQVVATDPDGDSMGYRWGTMKEFVDNTSTATYAPPTGMTLSSSGLISWDVRDTGGQATNVNDIWAAFVMVEDLDSGTGDNKSYIPIDFFLKIASASNDPPEIVGIPTTTQTISIGNTKTFTFTSTDNSGVAPTISVLNPPSDNSSIWSTSTSTSGGTTTFSISFTPVSSMDNATYAVNIRSTDGDGMTKDQTIGIKITSISNADPTAPTLVSPANGSTVVKPVTFQWTKSTDADNDAISYSLYFCTDSGFAGCSGTTVAAGGKLMPQFNQNLQDSLISWPRNLMAAPVYQQIPQYISMIPKWLILFTAFGLLSSLISFSLKNISNRKFLFMLILLSFFFILNINSCARSDSSLLEATSSSNDDNDTSSTSTDDTLTTTDLTYTTSNLTTGATYYWKVVATDSKGGSAESSTWSFTVQ